MDEIPQNKNLEVNFFSGEHAPAPPRLFAYAQVHLSLDSCAVYTSATYCLYLKTTHNQRQQKTKKKKKKKNNNNFNNNNNRTKLQQLWAS